MILSYEIGEMLHSATSTLCVLVCSFSPAVEWLCDDQQGAEPQHGRLPPPPGHHARPGECCGLPGEGRSTGPTGRRTRLSSTTVIMCPILSHSPDFDLVSSGGAGGEAVCLGPGGRVTALRLQHRSIGQSHGQSGDSC